MNRQKEIRRMFAKYGFTPCPLSSLEIIVCIRRGLSDEDIFSVGCDVFSGFSFRESVEACEL